MRKMLKASAVILVAGLAMQAQANLITNGSFETPDLDSVNNNGGSSWEVFSTINGWTTEAGTGIEIQKSGTVVNAYEGDQYVELDSHNFGLTGDSGSNSFMVQALNQLTVGETYALSFWYQPRTNRTDDNGINVYWGDSTLDLVMFADGQRNTSGGWQNFTTMLVATGEQMNLGFEAFGKQNTLGGFLDAVSLVEVPEPSTFGLLALGLIGLTAARRAKQA